MIKAILNGYYRSGTTLMYKILKRSNPECLVLYEPFHSNLPLEINNKYPEKLHDEHTYIEYTFLENFEKYINEWKKLRNSISNYKEIMLLSEHLEHIKRMFEILNKEEKEIILQTNRLHFILDKIKNKFNIPSIHIIRNPMDVFYSAIYNNARRKKFFFINYFYKIRHTKLGKFLAFKIFQHIRNRNLFGVHDNYKLLEDIFNLEYKKLTYFEMLLIVWTYFNYIATKNIGKENIFYYEEFMENPEKISRWIEKKLNCKFNPNTVKLKKINKMDLSEDDINMLNEYFEKLNLKEKVKYFYPKLIK